MTIVSLDTYSQTLAAAQGGEVRGSLGPCRGGQQGLGGWRIAQGSPHQSGHCSWFALKGERESEANIEKFWYQ